jgi:TonB family protein
MCTVENRAGPAKVAPIRFQPLLPKPAHPGRSLLAWGVPAAFFEVAGVLLLIGVTARSANVVPDAARVVHIVELPPEVALPKPPPPPQLPTSAPMTAADDAPPEVKGFQELAMPTFVLTEIPPPTIGTISINAIDFTGEGAPGGRGLIAREPEPGRLEAGPTFTPFTVAPFLRNSEQVTRTLAREYPPQLRSAAVGGRVLLWLFIDASGHVERTVLKTSSGFSALDEAAMRVALTMEFSPALNRDRRVPVWVAVPVDFEVE